MTMQSTQPTPIFIGGRFERSSATDTFSAVDPTTEDVLAVLPEATGDDLDRAIQAGVAAQDEWAAASWQRRARVLTDFAAALEQQAEQFAQLDVADSGNPIGAMRDDVAGGLQELRYFAGLASEVKGHTQPANGASLSFSERAPYGVVGRLVPYNHPFKAAVGKIAAPLAAGNAVILKPSEHCSLSALEMAKVAEHWLPAGLLSVLTGTGARIGAALVGHPSVPRISFTGSVATGRAVLHGGADHIKDVTVELGGKNPFIVFPDADVRKAARAAVRGMNLARSSGQSCMSTSRVYVHEDLHDAFVTELMDVVSLLRVGDPRDESTELGPMSFRAHYERVLRAVETAQAEGAELLCGGGRPPEIERGFFIAPTVFDRVHDTMAVATEEIFGPVMSILTWRTVDDVIARANRTEYGLTANIWCRDITAALSAARRVEAGYVFVNSQGKRPLGSPFGGWKASGLGKGASLAELLSYTREKAVTVDLG
ncbi:MAG TPA: aldehyde dehydrogenase family protein [Jatrophihabitans sp.]|nr:aldehyde dehydrogenase family protein [Jatrophihabitans sp.]